MRYELTDLKRYFITGKTHHVIATAKLAGLSRAHPLAAEPELALHVHGELGGAFTTELLNLRTQGGARQFLGDLVGVNFPSSAEAPGRLAAILQDRACLRVLASLTTPVQWKPIGVVPTYHRPAAESAILWSSDRLGMLPASGRLEYLAFDLIEDQTRCPDARHCDGGSPQSDDGYPQSRRAGVTSSTRKRCSGERS